MTDEHEKLPGAPDWSPGESVPDGWLLYACKGEGHDEPFEFLTPEILTGDEACPICDRPVAGIRSDAPQGVASEVCAAGLERAAELAAERNHEVLAAYTMVLLLPEDQVDSDEPHAHAGMWALIDADKGPAEPHEFLDFILAGARAFAERQGIEFATLSMPEVRGQG